jgi:hypothetical protein
VVPPELPEWEVTLPKRRDSLEHELVSPEGTRVSPEGTRVSPEGTRVSPEHQHEGEEDPLQLPEKSITEIPKFRCVENFRYRWTQSGNRDRRRYHYSGGPGEYSDCWMLLDSKAAPAPWHRLVPVCL